MPPVILSILYCNTWQEETHLFFWGAADCEYLLIFEYKKKYLATEVLKKQGYKDSNLELTESESVALPFGDSPMCLFFACLIACDE